jgi:hypothetical protein
MLRKNEEIDEKCSDFYFILSVEYVSLFWRRVMCQLWQLSSRDVIVFYSALGLTNSSAICSG